MTSMLNNSFTIIAQSRFSSQQANDIALFTGWKLPFFCMTISST